MQNEARAVALPDFSLSLVKDDVEATRRTYECGSRDEMKTMELETLAKTNAKQEKRLSGRLEIVSDSF